MPAGQALPATLRSPPPPAGPPAPDLPQYHPAVFQSTVLFLPLCSGFRITDAGQCTNGYSWCGPQQGHTLAIRQRFFTSRVPLLQTVYVVKDFQGRGASGRNPGGPHIQLHVKELSPTSFLSISQPSRHPRQPKPKPN